MRFFIVARNKEVIPDYKKELIKKGHIYSKENPDMILSLGGDGTLLVSENLLPEIPKLMIRDSEICNKCSINKFDEVIDRLKTKSNYTIKEYPKIECNFGSNNLIAINDIIIRNKSQREAIRFRIKINNIPYKDEFIGDGVVLSTTFGATGYFHAITKKTFKKGIGIAFNNINREFRDLVIKENSKVEILITRGDALLTADNQRKEFTLKTGDKVIIKKSKKNAKIVYLK